MKTQVFPKSFPPVNDAIEFLSQVDYKKHWSQLVVLSAEIAAIVVATVIWLYSTARQFWADHGDEIKSFVRKVYIVLQDAYVNAQVWWEDNGENVKNRVAAVVLGTYNAGRAARALLIRTNVLQRA